MKGCTNSTCTTDVITHGIKDVITKPNICSHVSVRFCIHSFWMKVFHLCLLRVGPWWTSCSNVSLYLQSMGAHLGQTLSPVPVVGLPLTFFGLIFTIRKGSVQWWGIDIWTGYLLFFAMLLACSRPLLGHGEIARWDTRIRMGCHANKQGTCSVMVFCVAAFLGKASYALNHKQLLVATYNCTPAHKY